LPTFAFSGEARDEAHPMKKKMLIMTKTINANKLAKNVLKKLLMGYIFSTVSKIKIFDSFKNVAIHESNLFTDRW